MHHMDARGDIEVLQRLATRQSGRVTRTQLVAIGIGRGRVEKWIARGVLIPCLPKVYALGYVSTTVEARLWEAVLYAGPGAMLSHLTAAQWCGYIKYAPAALHVSTPRKIASLPSVVVHARRSTERHEHAGLPVTTPAQTLLDLATVRPDLLPRALSQLDFQGVDLARVHPAAHSGNPGCAALSAALTSYDPSFAYLNDEFEISFYALCREWGIDPLPLPNIQVAPKLVVDALWPDHRLGVELDGRDNHHTPAQLLRDAERDLICRRLGLTIIRYRRAQLVRDPLAVKTDLQTQLALRA
jgi:hypothetical protein